MGGLFESAGLKRAYALGWGVRDYPLRVQILRVYKLPIELVIAFIGHRRAIMVIIRDSGMMKLLSEEAILLIRQCGHKGDFLKKRKGMGSLYLVYQNPVQKPHMVHKSFRRFREKPDEYPKAPKFSNPLMALEKEHRTNPEAWLRTGTFCKAES